MLRRRTFLPTSCAPPTCTSSPTPHVTRHRWPLRSQRYCSRPSRPRRARLRTSSTMSHAPRQSSLHSCAPARSRPSATVPSSPPSRLCWPAATLLALWRQHVPSSPLPMRRSHLCRRHRLHRHHNLPHVRQREISSPRGTHQQRSSSRRSTHKRQWCRRGTAAQGGNRKSCHQWRLPSARRAAGPSRATRNCIASVCRQLTVAHQLWESQAQQALPAMQAAPRYHAGAPCGTTC